MSPPKAVACNLTVALNAGAASTSRRCPLHQDVSLMRLCADLFFEGGDRLPIFLNVQLAPGDHLRSHVECFTPLIRDANGLERLPKRKGLAFLFQLILQLLCHRLNIWHW